MIRKVFKGVVMGYHFIDVHQVFNMSPRSCNRTIQTHSLKLLPISRPQPGIGILSQTQRPFIVGFQDTLLKSGVPWIDGMMTHPF